MRKRWLISSYESGVYEGTYWGIGTKIKNYSKYGPGYDPPVLDRLRQVRTDFDTFSDPEQLILMNHGWALADAALRSHLPTYLPNPVPVGSIPSPALLTNQQQALEALTESDKLHPLGR